MRSLVQSGYLAIAHLATNLKHGEFGHDHLWRQIRRLHQFIHRASLFAHRGEDLLLHRRQRRLGGFGWVDGVFEEVVGFNVGLACCGLGFLQQAAGIAEVLEDVIGGFDEVGGGGFDEVVRARGGRGVDAAGEGEDFAAVVGGGEAGGDKRAGRRLASTTTMPRDMPAMMRLRGGKFSAAGGASRGSSERMAPRSSWTMRS